MDIKQALKQYMSLRDEQEEVARRIRKLELALARLEEEGSVKDSVKGGYGGTQHFVIEGFPMAEYNDVRSALIRQRVRLTELHKEITTSVDAVHQLINEIDNSEIRRIITYRYVNGYTWDRVAWAMKGRYTGDSCYELVHRYLQKSSENKKEG